MVLQKQSVNQARALDLSRPLRVCLLGYRSNPHCGGQGVYMRNLARALVDLGHKVDVVSGPPYPELDPDVGLHKLPSLDLYNAEDPFRIPHFHELLDPVNALEWLHLCSGGFPEPMTFSLRALQYLSKKTDKYDVIHDNQCLAWGLWALTRYFPVVATIHHPITVDRDVAVQSVRSWFRKAQILRWYSFIDMQKQVARKMERIITVSECSKKDMAQIFPIRPSRIRVAPNGINTTLFRPLPGIEREPGRILVTNSADTPLKGLYHLLRAVDAVRKNHKVRLVVIGTPKKRGGVLRLIRELNLQPVVQFTGRVEDEEFVRQYARCSMAVVPSVYEGFGLPAGEAMAAGVPVISTTGGALPEVVGDAGILVPPKDPEALRQAIERLMENPEEARKLGEAGRKRVLSSFTWEASAKKHVQAYREAMYDHR